MDDNNKTFIYIQSLRRRMWITQGSRFNASRRLNSKYQYSIYSISILSIYGISIPILQSMTILNKCSQINNIYSVISIILSISILILSLLDSSQNYQVKAERLLNNATSIKRLIHELDYELANKDLKTLDDIPQVRNIDDRYCLCLEKCVENHEIDDYYLFMIQNYNEFNISWIGWVNLCLKFIYSCIYNYALYVAVILGLPILAWLLYLHHC